MTILAEPDPLFPPQAVINFIVVGFFRYQVHTCPCLHHYHLGVLRMSKSYVILKLVSRMLQKILTSPSKCSYNPETDNLLSGLPEDVKKGHFVVRTIYGGESRRVVVELSYLANPGFLKLLEQAEQEFGFKQTGILAIPCRHSDLQSILQTKE